MWAVTVTCKSTLEVISCMTLNTIQQYICITAVKYIYKLRCQSLMYVVLL